MSSSSRETTRPPPRLARQDPLIGSVIDGKYRVVDVIASGGMGRIYRGEQLALGRAVALKVLHASSAAHMDDPTFKRRFFREASILSRLQHPNIVTVFDYGALDSSDDRYFMAMELLQGQTLQRRISERVGLTVRETMSIGRQIARGVSEAHAQGVVHRDLKPSNVMLVAGRDGSELVKVLDFGIVKVLGEDDPIEELTQEGSFIGSPRYMAPEQITRGGKVDPRTDVYALGIMLYQCLTGTVPFDAQSSIETMMAHLNDEATPLRERARSLEVALPASLEELVMACIEKDPDRRPPSMEIVARVIEEAEAEVSLANAGIASVRAMPTLPPPSSAAAALSARHLKLSSYPSITHGGTQPGGGGGGEGASLPPLEVRDSHATPATRRRRLAPVLFGAVVLTCLVALLGARVTREASEQAQERANAAARERQRAEAAEPVAKKAFRLVLESTPPGAEVREASDTSDALLGTTPLTLAIDNDAARAAPRKLSIRKEGYVPYSIVQGASEDNVRVLATLARDASDTRGAPNPRGEGSTSHTSSGRPLPDPKPKPDPKPDPKRDPKLEIRLTR